MHQSQIIQSPKNCGEYFHAQRAGESTSSTLLKTRNVVGIRPSMVYAELLERGILQTPDAWLTSGLFAASSIEAALCVA